MPKLVKHPETGQPVYEQISYQNVERDQLQNALNENQNRVNDLQREVEAKTTELSEAQAALEDSKSNISAYDEIAGLGQTVPGTEGTGGENADENAEGSNGEVQVPVQF